MKRLELTVPLSLLDDLGILGGRFFRHNEAVEVLQSLSIRPEVAALIVRVRRRGPFKDEATVRREARTLARRYRLERFEVLSSDRERGEYVAWIEWTLPAFLREQLAGGWRGVAPLEVAMAGDAEARIVLLVSEAMLPRLRTFFDGLGAPYRVRAVRGAVEPWQPLADLTARQRELLALAYRLGYYDSPAKVSLDRIAGLVGITKAGLSKHLRAAERKVLGVAVGKP